MRYSPLMSTTMPSWEQLRADFQPAAEQGFGVLSTGEHADLGAAVYEYRDGPEVEVYEKGIIMMTDGQQPLETRFQDIQELGFLDLRELALASTQPASPVTLTVQTVRGRWEFDMPLHLYTTLASALMRLQLEPRQVQR